MSREDVERLGVGDVHTLSAHGHTVRYLNNGYGAWRFQTLLEKEPETIEWIETFQPGETMWDIGANVGIYSIYAGLRGTVTTAFEPHFANYFQLCVNIVLNDLQERVTPLCLAIDSCKSVGTINLSTLVFGASMSSFGNDLDFRGAPYSPVYRQGMIGYDIDSYVSDFGIKVPNHIKIDVDGIELDIIKGARITLGRADLKSVSIELIESDKIQVDTVTDLLAQAGLYFVHKRQNIDFASADTTDVLNYLYRRRL
jgi:FkbM family methyltransferase